MTRYFFDVYDDLVVIDEVGREHESLASAQEEAVVAVSGIAKDLLPRAGTQKDIAVKVRDETGDVVLTAEIKFAVRLGG
jgi:DNA-directed RNA polymerase subunit H (RpoH/RPB5)